MRPVLALALLLSLCGCNEDPRQHSYADERLETELIRPPAAISVDSSAPAAPAMAYRMEPPAGPAAEGYAPSGPRNIAVAVGLPMLAYSYRYGVEAPPRQIAGLVGAHEKACRDAGPAVCQVLSSRIDALGEDRVSGAIHLRAQADWLTRFRDGLAGQAKAAGGRIAETAIETDDLSSQIVDTEARLRAMTTLRDRLLALLASRPGKLPELLAVEHELATVQGDINSASSQLAMMRARVATSALSLTYRSAGVIAPQGVFAPLMESISGSFTLVIQVLAGLITLLVVLSPFLAIGGALIWLFRKQLARIIRPRAGPGAPPLVLGETGGQQESPTP